MAGGAGAEGFIFNQGGIPTLRLSSDDIDALSVTGGAAGDFLKNEGGTIDALAWNDGNIGSLATDAAGERFVFSDESLAPETTPDPWEWGVL